MKYIQKLVSGLNIDEVNKLFDEGWSFSAVLFNSTLLLEKRVEEESDQDKPADDFVFSLRSELPDETPVKKTRKPRKKKEKVEEVTEAADETTADIPGTV